jgi:hypothetical protein
VKSGVRFVRLRRSTWANPTPGDAFAPQLLVSQFGNENFEVSVGEVCACMLEADREVLSNTSLSAIGIVSPYAGRAKDILVRDSNSFLWN